MGHEPDLRQKETVLKSDSPTSAKSIVSREILMRNATIAPLPPDAITCHDMLPLSCKSPSTCLGFEDHTPVSSQLPLQNNQGLLFGQTLSLHTNADNRRVCEAWGKSCGQ